MLYLIYGNDWERVRAKAREVLDLLKTKRPEASIVSLEEEGVSEQKIEELAGSQGLFERKFIVFGDRVCADSSSAEILQNKIDVISKSENVFLLLEGELKVGIVKVFEKKAFKVEKFEKVEKKERFNSFLLADALGDKNKQNLWVLYRMAINEGLSPEELHGTLFWQAKTLRAVTLAKSAEEAGLKPFAWSKAKRYVSKWNESELRNLTNNLVSIYHDSRRGEHEMETALEKFILDL